MEADRTPTYRVLADEKGWAIIRDGRGDPLWRSAVRADAVEYARRVATANRPSRLLLYDESGALHSRCNFD